MVDHKSHAYSLYESLRLDCTISYQEGQTFRDTNGATKHAVVILLKIDFSGSDSVLVSDLAVVSRVLQRVFLEIIPLL